MSSNLLKASKLTFCRVDVALCPIGWASGFPLEAGSVKRDIDIRSGGCCSIILGYSSHTHPRHSVRAQKASNQPAGKSWIHQRRSAGRRKTTSARRRRKTTRNAIPTMKASEDAMWKKSRRTKNGRWSWKENLPGLDEFSCFSCRTSSRRWHGGRRALSHETGETPDLTLPSKDSGSELCPWSP